MRIIIEHKSLKSCHLRGLENDNPLTLPNEFKEEQHGVYHA